MLALLESRHRPRPWTGSTRPRFRPTRDVLATERDGLVVLLDLRRGVYIGLDETGSCLWRGIEAGCTADELVAGVTSEYDATVDAVRADAFGFVTELRRLCLVTCA